MKELSWEPDKSPLEPGDTVDRYLISGNHGRKDKDWHCFGSVAKRRPPVYKSLHCSNVQRKIGFPSGSAGKESSCDAGDVSLIPGSGRLTGEEISYPFQYPWASLVAQTVKNLPAMPETSVQSLGWENSLEEGLRTHSSRQPMPGESLWREEPGGLQSIGSQRVGHDWVTKHSTAHRKRCATVFCEQSIDHVGERVRLELWGRAWSTECELQVEGRGFQRIKLISFVLRTVTDGWGLGKSLQIPWEHLEEKDGFNHPPAHTKEDEVTPSSRTLISPTTLHIHWGWTVKSKDRRWFQICFSLLEWKFTVQRIYARRGG